MFGISPGPTLGAQISPSESMPMGKEPSSRWRAATQRPNRTAASRYFCSPVTSERKQRPRSSGAVQVGVPKLAVQQIEAAVLRLLAQALFAPEHGLLQIPLLLGEFVQLQVADQGKPEGLPDVALAAPLVSSGVVFILETGLSGLLEEVVELPDAEQVVFVPRAAVQGIGRQEGVPCIFYIELLRLLAVPHARPAR